MWPRDVLPGNWGALLTTEDETVELGVLGGRRVRGVVQRRVLRLGVGPRARFVGFRLRPVAVEVDGERVAIAAPGEPRLRAAGGALALLVLSMVARRAWRRARRREVER